MIKFFLSDLDGTLTDAGYYVVTNGDILKKFNTKDFYGMHGLVKSGVRCGIITSSVDAAIDAKRETFKFPLDVYKRVDNKKEFVADLLHQFNYDWSHVAYVGDDINDLELLEAAGMAACPKDSEAEVIALVKNRDDGWVLDRNGGAGCVREFINIVQEVNDNERL